MNTTLSIIYFSAGGTADLLAQSVAAGARSVPDTTIALHRIDGTQIKEGRWEDPGVLEALTQSDSIVFGAPTYMGGPAAQFKAFADATAYLWRSRAWRGKLAGGFTISGNPSGDKLLTLMYLSVFASQHGMTWMNWDELPRQPDGTNHLGSSLGLMAQNPVPPGAPPALSDADDLSAKKYGIHMALTARRLLGRAVPATVASV